MTSCLKTLVRRTLMFVGPVMLLVSTSESLRKSSEAEQYYRSARPLIEKLITSQSGNEDAPSVPVVEFEDRIRFMMSQTKLDGGFSFTTLRWLIIAGVTLTWVGLILDTKESKSCATPPGTGATGGEPASG